MAVTSTRQLLHQTLLGEAWEHAPVPLALFDDDRNYIAVNEAFCRLAGCEREELLQLRAGDALAGDEAAAGVFEAALRDGRARGTGMFRRQDGSLLPARFLVFATSVGGLSLYLSLVEDESPDGVSAGAD